MRPLLPLAPSSKPTQRLQAAGSIGLTDRLERVAVRLERRLGRNPRPVVRISGLNKQTET